MLVNCDHIGWNSSKIISPLASLGCSLFATPTWRVCSKGNTSKFGPKLTHPCWFERRRHSIANCGREWLQIAQRSQWRAYRKLPSLFLMVPSLTPYDLPFPQNGVPYAPNIREWPYLCNRWSDPLYVLFYGGIFGDGGFNGAISGSNKSKMAAAAILEKFQMAISPQPVVRSTSCFVLGWGFRGRRI